MIRVPQTEASMSEKDAFPLPGSASDSGQPAGLAQIVPVATPNADVIPDPTLAARQAQLDDAAGIVRADDGTARNRADATRDPDGIQLTPSDAYISSKTAKVKLKQKSLTQLDELGTPVDPESEEGAGAALPIAQQQQEQVAGLAETALAEVEQATDPETRTALEEQATQVVETHDAAATVEADRIRKTQAKQAAVEAVSTTVDYAARLYEEPEARARQMVELDEDIEELGALEGWTEPQIVEEQRKARAQVHEKIVDRLIATDPQRARMWVATEAENLGGQKDKLLGRVTIVEQAQKTAKLAETYLSSDDPLPTEQEFRDAVFKDQGQSSVSTDISDAINADASAQYTALVAARKKQDQAHFFQTSDEVQAGKVDPLKFVKLKDEQQAELILLHHENETAARNGKVRSTDTGMFGKLFGQGLRNFADADLVSIRSRLSEDDFQAMVGLQKQYVEASKRDRILMQQYFAGLSDLAAQSDRHSVQMDILEAGLAEFVEEGSIPNFGRQTEMLDTMAHAYRLRPMEVRDLPMPNDSMEELARKKAAFDKRFERLDGQTRKPAMPPPINVTATGDDFDWNQAGEDFGIEALAKTFGVAEIELRNFLNADHKKFQDIWGIWQDEEGKVLRKVDSNKMAGFTKLMGERLGRDFLDGLKTNAGAVEQFGQLVDRIENGGMAPTDPARKGLLERGQAKLISELVMHDDFFRALDKIGKYGGRSLALLNMAQSFHEIVKSGFDKDTIIDEGGSSAGGMIGASIGALLGGVCGPFALGCAIVFSGAGGAVGSYVGENARGWIEDLMPMMTGHGS